MVSIAVESLASCMACDLAMLDYGETLLDMLHELNVTHMGVLADRKTPHSDLTPQSTVGIVFGAVRRHEHVLRLRQLRARVDILLALGTCAVTGGVPAMALLPGADLDKDLQQRHSTVPGPATTPYGDEDLLSTCLPVNHHVRVDLEVPGCPPHPDWIAECLLSMLDARTPQLPQRSVCDHCPARRTGGAPLDSTLLRMLELPEAPQRGARLEDLPCLLEQGFLCMGPVTRGGCGGKDNPPRCIDVFAPCRGCHGPAHNRPSLVDVAGVLAAAGYDLRTIPDIPGFLSRFGGMYMMKHYRKDG